MKKKGFTLLELLGVVIVLAVIAVVSVPIVLDVIEDARISANKSTVYGIIDAAKLYYTESILDEEKKATLGSGDIYNLITVNGEKPENGKLYITEKGKVSLSLTMDDKCFVKTFDSEVNVYESSKSECADYVGEDYIIPVVDFEITGIEGNNDWYVSDVYVKLLANDIDDDEGNQSGIDYINWCTGEDCTPTNKLNSTLIFQENSSIIVCAQSYDKAGNASDKKCTNTLNIDKTDPTAGTILVNGKEYQNIWYGEDLTITEVDGNDTEALVESGHDKTTVDVTSITATTNEKIVTVTTFDKAGNESTREYKIKLDKEIPNVNITKENNSTLLTATVSNSTSMLSGYTYQWYKDEVAIENATTNAYQATKEGTYKVVVTTTSGNTGTSNEIEIQGYTVSYNTNGSEDTIESQTKVEDITLTLSSTVPVRDGYTFLGWSVNSDSKTTEYASGVNYTANNNLELYAIWKKTLTATFVENGSTLSYTKATCDIYNAETECEITAPTITRSGYIVVGFGLNTTDEGATILSGAKTNISDNITYIALTKEVTLSVNKASVTTYVGAKNTTVIASGNNFGTLSCSSSNTNVANCTTSGTTITVTPGGTSGSAVLTIMESNVSKTATITVNNKTASFDITASFTATDAKYYASDNVKYWLNSDYYVGVSVTSDETITKIEMCTATTNTCDPTGKSSANSTSGSMLISQESNNNRVCVQGYDSLGRKSSVECSEAFGLDKTKPTAGTILVNGNAHSTNWYNTSLVITPVDGTDASSGHLNTSVDVENITSNTTASGKVVTVTTFDKAGNSSTRTYTLKVDITTPSVSISKTSGSTKLTANVSNLSSIVSGYSYQWYKGTTAISGATQSTYTPTTSGIYKVVVTTGANKSGTSNEITINSYTVKYDMNGGTGTIANQTKVEDIALTLSSTTPSRTGYTFKGWSTSSTATSATYTSGGSYTENASNTLYAVWQVNSYTCQAGKYLNASSTSCTTCEAGSYCPGGTYNYSSNVQGKETCPTFYASSASGSDNINDCYMTTTQGNYIATSKATSETTCPKGSYCLGGSTVKYGSTGGSTICPTGYTNSDAGSNEETDCYLTTTSGKYIATAKSATQSTCTANYYCAATRINYGSTGGRTSCPSGYGTSASGSDAQTDCYKTYTLSYNANSGSGTPNSQTCNVYYNNSSCDITISLSTTPSRTGYTYKGWSTSSTATSATYANGSKITISANTTLYAVWQANSYACAAGTYLNASSTSCTTCPAGSYCPGGTYNYSSTVQGKNACPSGYTSSASGSSASSQCYKTITVTYAGNGATSGSTSSSSCNAYYNNGSCSITLNANGFAKTNFNFIGWGTGTTSVSHNASTAYSFSTNTTLNAIWQASYTCPNGGTLTQNTSYSSGTNGWICVIDASATSSCSSYYYCTANDNYVYKHHVGYTDCYISRCSTTTYDWSESICNSIATQYDNCGWNVTYSASWNGSACELYSCGSGSTLVYEYECCSSWSDSYYCPSGWYNYTYGKCYNAASN